MSKPTSKTPTLYVRQDQHLPSNKLWENRFEVRSETSDRVYVIAQNIEKRHWACSCPAWRTRRTCKHLIQLALPTNEKPYEVRLDGGAPQWS